MTIENPTTIETAKLSAKAIAEAETLASEATGLFDAELKSERRRALLYRALAAYVLRYGLEAINAHAKKAGYDGEESKLTYQLAAQFLTRINIFSATDEQRAERQTVVRPFALMLDALVRRAGEHSEFDEADWFAWYRANGQQKGLLGWLKAQGASAAKAVAQVPTPDSIVDDAFGSPAAVTFPADFVLPDLIPGRPMLVMVRQDETGIRAVPLPKAGSSAMASVAGYRATGLENAPPKLRFWHLLMSIGTAIVPDTTSQFRLWNRTISLTLRRQCSLLMRLICGTMASSRLPVPGRMTRALSKSYRAITSTSASVPKRPASSTNERAIRWPSV